MHLRCEPTPRGILESLHGANDPNHGSNLNSSLSGQSIGNEGGRQRSKQRTSWHGTGDTTLAVRSWMAKVILVGIGSQNSAPTGLISCCLVGMEARRCEYSHGADIETEETTANGGEGTNGIGVCDVLHLA